MPPPRGLIVAIGIVMLCSAAAGRGDSPITVHVDINTTQTHQTIEGFGATHITLTDGATDHLSPALRKMAIDATYRQVHLTTGNVETGVIEAPAAAADLWKQQANDDDDPFHYNWSGFNFVRSDAAKAKLIDLARPLGFTEFYPGLKVNLHWASTWLKPIRQHDYNRYLDECAEQIVAGALHWRDAYQITPRYIQLFNEPTTGNHELDPGSTREVVDIIKRAGARLRHEGFATTTFIVPGEETEDASLRTAAAILADADARPYVGAIAYHPYPYGSTYSLVANILDTSGRGRPVAEMVAVRQRLRDLGKRYDLPVWMTEVSHGGVPALSFDGLLGRAIHIHDELVYADAAAYFCMMNMGSTLPMHGHGNDPFSQEGAPVIVDLSAEKVHITGMGYAIGHYARWIDRGAVRVEATSSDSLFQTTAFRSGDRLVMVWINAADHPAEVQARFTGESEDSVTFSGEQSTAQAAWAPIAPGEFHPAVGLTMTVPARSVTTIATAVAPGPAPQP